MKKLLIGATVAMALGSSAVAQAASTILFDPTGAGGAGIAVDSFDWLPGNALAIGAFSTPPVGGSVTFELRAQGRLGSFVAPGGTPVAPPAGEFTFQTRFFETAIGIGTAATSFSAGAQPLTSLFTIYFDAAADSNPVTGAGYGNGTPILSGTLRSAIGGFVDNTSLFSFLGAANPFPIALLDQLNIDNQGGTLTRQGNGATSITIDATSQHSGFFRSNVTGLLVDLQDTTFNSVPFAQTDPSDAIFGVVPNYSRTATGRVNGGDPAGSCALGGQTEGGVNTARCDLHLQTDATTSFNPSVVPEPGTLALLGLGLLAASGVRRRKATA